jgi:hypothetical protein
MLTDTDELRHALGGVVEDRLRQELGHGIRTDPGR